MGTITTNINEVHYETHRRTKSETFHCLIQKLLSFHLYSKTLNFNTSMHAHTKWIHTQNNIFAITFLCLWKNLIFGKTIHCKYLGTKCSGKSLHQTGVRYMRNFTVMRVTSRLWWAGYIASMGGGKKFIQNFSGETSQKIDTYCSSPSYCMLQWSG